jgi:hypothetical protein
MGLGIVVQGGADHFDHDFIRYELALVHKALGSQSQVESARLFPTSQQVARTQVLLRPYFAISVVQTVCLFRCRAAQIEIKLNIIRTYLPLVYEQI